MAIPKNKEIGEKVLMFNGADFLGQRFVFHPHEIRFLSKAQIIVIASYRQHFL
jgi:hypothetical protein